MMTLFHLTYWPWASKSVFTPIVATIPMMGKPLVVSDDQEGSDFRRGAINHYV
jgi:hypothetical protein